MSNAWSSFLDSPTYRTDYILTPSKMYLFPNDFSSSPHTTLPALPSSRSPSPSIFESMKDLMPAPLRSKTRSPILRSRTADGERKHKPTPEVGAGAEWGYRLPRRVDDLPQARSVSPMPCRPSLEQRSRSSPQRVGSPPPRYLRIPREDITEEQVEETPPTRQIYAPYRQPAQQVREPIHSPRALQSPKRRRLQASGRQPRRYIPSMIDYLTMEQLEDVWQMQDIYKGTVDVPAKPATPVWRMEDDMDPRSPLIEMVHPAFRNEPHSFHNSFSRPVA